MTPSYQKLVALLAGTADGEPLWVDGGFLWMHRPDIAPLAYRHRVYDGLDDDGLREVGERYGARANRAALGWLSAANGARLFDGRLFLNGFATSERRDPANALGQPVSLDYGNLFGTPETIRPDHFVVGSFVLGEASPDRPRGCRRGIRS